MLLQRFQEHWKKNFELLSSHDLHLVVAVSGGLDSVVLTNLLYQSSIPFSVAHCNFKLRGQESFRDEKFVIDLAHRYGKTLFLKRFETKAFADGNKISVQEAARQLRYDWFREILCLSQSFFENSATQFIATAHHANDNIETLLINFFRGTGLSGLHGILPKQNKIIRPLLFAKREEILQYAKENQLTWVEDSSNAYDKYTRNFIRHRLLPAATEIFEQAEDNLIQNIQRFSEAEVLYQQAVALHKKKLLQVKGNEVHIPVLKLQKSEPLTTILWEIVKEYQFTTGQLPDIQNLLTADSGKYVSSLTHRILKNRNWLIIAPLQSGAAGHILIEKKDKEIIYEDGLLSLQQKEANTQLSIDSDKNIAMVDMREVRFPLLLRKWKTGDYFYPLGMTKKKKLSRFFIDNKLSQLDKEKVWVIESNKKIIWIIGYRIDNRFKIESSTKRVLLIEKK